MPFWVPSATILLLAVDDIIGKRAKALYCNGAGMSLNAKKGAAWAAFFYLTNAVKPCHDKTRKGFVLCQIKTFWYRK